MLKDVVTSGTGGGAQVPNMDTCGKTGTTDEDKDRWFIGYTPYYVGSVWYGYDIPKSLPYSGTNPSLTAWNKVMTKIHESLPAKHFVKPDGVEQMTVCSRTGKKPSSTCTAVTEYVSKSAAREKCSGEHGYIGTKSSPEYYENLEENGENGENPEDNPQGSHGGDNGSHNSNSDPDEIPTIILE